jgi:hypothetical protein
MSQLEPANFLIAEDIKNAKRLIDVENNTSKSVSAVKRQKSTLLASKAFPNAK